MEMTFWLAANSFLITLLRRMPISFGVSGERGNSISIYRASNTVRSISSA